jgi:hypothetical protein
VVLESHLHTRGYTYVGQNSLYDLTWIEIYRLIDAANVEADEQDGVRRGDLDKFERYNERLKE